MTHVLAIDQGTTSTRAILFDAGMRPVASAQEEFAQHYPAPGWVEHDPEDLWRTALRTALAAIAKSGLQPEEIAGLGITNQRETTLVWDRQTGRPIHNAIVWQDRRTADRCEDLKGRGYEEMVTARTGLLLDPYFSGTKLAWLLDHVEGARERARAGELLFGTVDTWLIWNLTGGGVHATDATNAARTLLYDIHKGRWSEPVCEVLGIPMEMLPRVKDSSDFFGVASRELLGAGIPILGVAGDQQAATVGQACFLPGTLKSTYGTGCFALLNTGETPVRSRNRLLMTIAYQLEGQPYYALERPIFIAGAAVQWLRDGLRAIDTAARSQSLARQADTSQEVVMVPAFTGFGAPYWQPHCRGAVFGLTRGSGAAELARAALESVAFQTRDLLEAMHADWTPPCNDGVLRVDGGLSVNDWAMQFLSDMLGARIDRPGISETTALGAAWLAGMEAGVYPDMQGFAEAWSLDRAFAPEMAAEERTRRYAGWKRAVRATLSMADPPGPLP